MRRSRQRIALNAQLLQISAGYRSAGISRYILHLLRALPSAAPDLELHAFTHESHARDAVDGLRLHFTRPQTRSPLVRILWEQLAFPIDLARVQFDLCHSMAFVSPVLTATPSVVTVYDLSFLIYPAYFQSLNRIYLSWGTRYATTRARRVIAISESTKRDLVRLLGVPEERIDVIPPGVATEFFPNGDDGGLERFRHLKNLPDRFLLFVGTQEPRKNIPNLIRAFAAAKSKLGYPLHLVLVGGHGWKDDGTRRALEESGVQNEVHFSGFVPTEELPYWYRAAEAFVYPSRYEGFGMPPLEALAAGTPVITGKFSSLPEAVGDAALLVDPSDQPSLENAMVKILSDRGLREELIAKGRERARLFTWARTAQATASVYRRVLSQGRS